jgi:hypothetical protein
MDELSRYNSNISLIIKTFPMKKSHFSILAIFIVVLCFSACSKEDSSSDSDYLIFGHFYGECGGESCIEIYKIDENGLYEDQNDIYPINLNFYDGDFIKLPHHKYEEVKDLISYFPNGLFNESEIVIGSPDAGDWGGLYVEYNFDGKREFWLLDQLHQNVPHYLHAFIDEINYKISLINE